MTPMESRSATQSIRNTAVITAALVVILAGMRASAEVTTPILTAWFVSTLLLPVYGWLRRKRLPNWAALLVLIVGLFLVGLALWWLMRTSVLQLSQGLSQYQEALNQRLSAFTQSFAGETDLVQNTGLTSALNAEQLIGVLGTLLSAIGNALVGAAMALILTVFLILEGQSFSAKLNAGLGDNPVLLHLRGLGTSIVRYFGARTIINLGTGAAVAVVFLLIGIDYALLWGVLIFFLSYVPYVGITLATIPAVLLGWAEFGAWMAVLVVVIVVIANFAAENIFAPALTGKILNLSPTLVLVAFIFWSWMLGPLGFILSMPLTVLVMLILDSFEETRWLAILMGMPKPPETA